MANQSLIIPSLGGTTACAVSLSSVPAFLPPISFFLISIRMTFLGRNVYPPPCHPAPPNHTTNHVHHHEKITFEFQEIKLLIQNIPKTNETAACRLSPPALFPKPMSPSLLSCQNGHLEPATSPKIKRQTTSCTLSACRCNLSCLSHSLLPRLRFQVETQKPSVGWRRPTGWHISQVFFCKVATDDWALLQKNDLNDMRSFGFLPSCNECRSLTRIFSTTPPLPPSYRGRVPMPHLHATTSCLSYHRDR